MGSAREEEEDSRITPPSGITAPAGGCLAVRQVLAGSGALVRLWRGGLAQWSGLVGLALARSGWLWLRLAGAGWPRRGLPEF